MRNVHLGSVNQSIVFHAFDTDGAAVVLNHTSPGLSIYYVVDVDGREGIPVVLTPITRSIAGVHEDGAITSKGNGKHEVDLPDSAIISVGYVRLIVSATAVTGRVYSEVIAVGAIFDPAIEEQLASIKSDTIKIRPRGYSRMQRLYP